MRKVLILTGDGINSENELALAFSREGAQVEKRHVNELMKAPEVLDRFQLLAIPGGFSFGDEIRSGKILAEKLRDRMMEALFRFLKSDGRILGICNGFQVMAQLGIFSQGERSFTLAENDHGKFMDKWTKLSVKSRSAWLTGIEGEIYLPVRHREGRIIPQTGASLNPALTYASDINGSFEMIAGLTDISGNVFGLMPHPEVATMSFLHPFTEGAEENAQKVRMIFRNGLK